MASGSAKPLAGAAAALLVYLSPIVGIDGTTAYTDVAVGGDCVLGVLLDPIWDEQRDGRILIAIGLLAGYCYAAKYTAFVMLVYAVGFVAWRTRRMATCRVAGGGVLADHGRAVGRSKTGFICATRWLPLRTSVFRIPIFICAVEQTMDSAYCEPMA